MLVCSTCDVLLWTCRCPRLVASKTALLAAHLGGRAYSLRSAIITAIGHLVHKAFNQAPGEDADAQGEHPNKQHRRLHNCVTFLHHQHLSHPVHRAFDQAHGEDANAEGGFSTTTLPSAGHALKLHMDIAFQR